MINKKLKKGSYTPTYNKAIEELSLLLEKQQKIKAINMALVLGEKSGKPKEFDYDHFLMKMENKFRTYVKPFDSLK